MHNITYFAYLCYAYTEGRTFDLEIARAFLDFFQSLLSGYDKFMRNHKFDAQAHR